MNSKTIISAVSLLLILMTSVSCSYEKLPPKTSDASTQYVTPKGVLPTDEEIAVVKAAQEEYRQSIQK